MQSRASRTLCALALLGAVVGSWGVRAEEIRDYYAEPGLNPFKEELHDLNEAIDPFSGILQHRYTDILVPGNGGLNIQVNRVYTNRQDSVGLGTRSVAGAGWTMHFGRIVVPSAHRDKICTQQSYDGTTLDNPSIEYPDGRRELLVLRDLQGETLITKSNWKADCQGVASGMRVTAPNGVTHYMDVAEYAADTQGVAQFSWYTSRIEDLDGNWISLSYGTATDGSKYIRRIDASDGRVVTYEYRDADGPGIRLWRVTANGQTFEYRYALVTAFPGSHYQLVEVVRPDQLSWRYSYYSQLPATQGGSYSMKSVTYPHGGKVEYSYQQVRFDIKSTEETTVVASKKTSGPDIRPGTWTYEFLPSSEMGVWDRTIVRSPVARIEYDHQGYVTGGTLLWPVGLLGQKRVYLLEGTDPLETITNVWDKRQISAENYWHGRDTGRLDHATYAPVLVQSQHWRDGAAVSIWYRNYDRFGNPQLIEEECILEGCDNRVIERSYLNDESSWMIGLPTEETIQGIGTISRSYYPNGRLASLERYGVTTHYTYHPTGDLETETNARGYTTSYSDYYRGIPREESREVGPGRVISISCEVNDTGTVASRTNGRGHTTAFGYDGLNRLTEIHYPIHDDVVIAYGLGERRLSRGSYEEVTHLDGVGNTLRLERRDLDTGDSIEILWEFDELGRETFASYPNSTLGTQTVYDALDRPIRITHGDGSFRVIEYGQFHSSGMAYLADKRITDERGHVTLTLDQYYGSYDKAVGLTNVLTEHNMTSIERDAAGRVLAIAQSRFDTSSGRIDSAQVRRYGYDSRGFLVSVDNPETGLTRFGRDETGNKTSIQVGDSPLTRYFYDGVDRVYRVDYPGDTPDVESQYDANHNLTRITKGATEWVYEYDANDNLMQEQLTFTGEAFGSFTLAYGYDGRDELSRVVYPNGISVDYSPDALGRPTAAGPYAPSVTYHANGAMARLAYANGTLTRFELNDRQWIETLESGLAGPGDILDLLYEYDAAGNVISVDDAVTPENSVSLYYDGINRLVGADGPWGEGDILYSSQGDVRQKILGIGSADYRYGSASGGSRLSSIAGSSPFGYPWLTYVGYDSYGNQLNNLDAQFRYSHASNLIAAGADLERGIDIAYDYDGHNHRVVERITDTNQTVSVSTRDGRLFFERDGGELRRSGLRLPRRLSGRP